MNGESKGIAPDEVKRKRKERKRVRGGIKTECLVL